MNVSFSAVSAEAACSCVLLLPCAFNMQHDGVASIPCHALRQVPRQTMNALTTSANVQIAYLGGSFQMDRSEVSYSHDDVSDLSSTIGWTTANGRTSDTIWTSVFPPWKTGQQVSLYDAHSLERRSTAKIISIDSCKNQTALHVLNAALKASGMEAAEVDFLRLIRLNKGVQVSSPSWYITYKRSHKESVSQTPTSTTASTQASIPRVAVMF